MKKIAVVTDSNSGISKKLAEEKNIFLLPMPFLIDGEEYYEWENLTAEEFYAKLKNDCEILTSQPSPESTLKLWDKVLEEYDEIVHIPMSSGLSSEYQTACMFAEDYEGKVFVVNNQRISVTMKQSVRDAFTLIRQGKDAKEIKEILEERKHENNIYIMVDTLKYLQKGGRITPAVAMLGNLLKIKPILQINGEKLDTFAKARTVKQAKAVMIEAIKNDIENKYDNNKNGDVTISLAHTDNSEAVEQFRQEVAEIFKDIEIVDVDDLSLSVSCHIGPGALAITCQRVIK
ncbi:EDD domain protein, DegV family [Lachnospiraceae bacterium RM5]|nr:EDD domain protein, DegV family [Lachnospiraceae bacterium RM5]